MSPGFKSVPPLERGWQAWYREGDTITDGAFTCKRKCPLQRYRLLGFQRFSMSAVLKITQPKTINIPRRHIWGRQTAPLFKSCFSLPLSPRLIQHQPRGLRAPVITYYRGVPLTLFTIGKCCEKTQWKQGEGRVAQSASEHCSRGNTSGLCQGAAFRNAGPSQGRCCEYSRRRKSTPHFLKQHHRKTKAHLPVRQGGKTENRNSAHLGIPALLARNPGRRLRPA